MFFFFGNNPLGCAAPLHGFNRFQKNPAEQNHAAIGGCQLLVTVADFSLCGLTDIVFFPHLTPIGHIFALVIFFYRLRGRRSITGLISFLDDVPPYRAEQSRY